VLDDKKELVRREDQATLWRPCRSSLLVLLMIIAEEAATVTSDWIVEEAVKISGSVADRGASLPPQLDMKVTSSPWHGDNSNGGSCHKVVS
jgi:hypothetical protein